METSIKKHQGPLYVALAAVLWSFGGVGTKYIPWSALSIVCFRGIFATFTVGALRRSFRVRMTPATVVSALAMAGTVTLFVSANKLSSTANAIVFQYTAPIYVILITMVLLKKRPRPIELLTVALVFVGIALFFLEGLGGGTLTGDLLALLSGVTFATMTIINSLHSSDPEGATLLGNAITALLFPMLFLDPGIREGGFFPLVICALLGVFQLGLPYYLFAKGIQETGAVATSIISTAEPILNPIWVFLLMGERPGPLALVGAVIVIGSILIYNVISAKQQEQAESKDTPNQPVN